MWYRRTPLDKVIHGFKIFTIQFGYGIAFLSLVIGVLFLPAGWPLIANSVIYYMCARSLAHSIEQEMVNRLRAGDYSSGDKDDE